MLHTFHSWVSSCRNKFTLCFLQHRALPLLVRNPTNCWTWRKWIVLQDFSFNNFILFIFSGNGDHKWLSLMAFVSVSRPLGRNICAHPYCKKRKIKLLKGKSGTVIHLFQGINSQKHIVYISGYIIYHVQIQSSWSCGLNIYLSSNSAREAPHGLIRCVVLTTAPHLKRERHCVPLHLKNTPHRHVKWQL